MVTVPENELLNAALSYADRGWAVLPLHSVAVGVCSCGKHACGSPGKHPRNISGSLGASTDTLQIRSWWEEWPEANVGISTGTKSGIAVVDADGQAGLSSLKDLGLHSSFAVNTGSGGLHLYYQYTEGVKNSARKLGAGLDVRGEGGYVVAPPSVHQSGRKYTFNDTGDLVPYPVPPSPQGPSYEVTGVSERIAAGQRNSVLTSLAGTFRNKGLGEEEIYVALQGVNTARCDPRLRDDELRGIAHSVSRYRPENPVFHSRARVPRIQVQTARELCSITLPSQDELVGPLLVRGNRLVVAGHTGEGKTTFALQLIRAYLGGDRFLKWQPRDGVRVCRALVIDAEQGVRTVQRRLREAGVHESDTLDYIRVPDGLNLDDSAEADQIEETLANKKYDVVVLDPLYKLHKGEMTDERAAVELMRQLDHWREKYHFALILLAHCRKPAQGYPFTIHDVFGSTALSRGAEIVLGLQRTGVGTSRLHFFKDRDGDLPVGESWELLFDASGRGYESTLHRQRDGEEVELYDNVSELDDWR